MKKVVFVTGISSGFGKAISKYLFDKGYIVYGTIRSECEVAKGVNTVYLDLTQAESIEAAVKTIIEKEGRIDVLINNAGMHSGGSVEDTPISVLEQQFSTNVLGWVDLIQQVLPHMRKQKSGTIINISSIGGLTSLPFQGIYSSSKHAMEGISSALRMELRAFNIKVIVVNPGDFKTRNTETRIVSLPNNSPYKEQFEKSLAIIVKDETEGQDPKILARKIHCIIEAKRPNSRYIIGTPVEKLACVCKRLLPEKLFSWAIAKHYGIK